MLHCVIANAQIMVIVALRSHPIDTAINLMSNFRLMLRAYF